MNTMKIFAVAVFSVLLGCIPVQPVFPVEGDGNIVSRDIEVSGFHAIEVSHGFDLILVQGNNESLSLTADENLFEFIRSEVKEGVLKIYIEKKNFQSRELKARVQFKALDRVMVTGGGDVRAENSISGDKLELNISGGGDLELKLAVNELTNRMSGGGDAHLNGKAGVFNSQMSGGGDLSANLEVKSLFCSMSGGGDAVLGMTGEGENAEINLSGGGDLNLNIRTGKLDCSLSGGGDARLQGSALGLNVSVRGGGDILAQELSAGIVRFDANGGSDVHVKAQTEIKGSISGGGNAYCSGEAKLIQIDATGGSEVRRE